MNTYYVSVCVGYLRGRQRVSGAWWWSEKDVQERCWGSLVRGLGARKAGPPWKCQGERGMGSARTGEQV